MIKNNIYLLDSQKSGGVHMRLGLLSLYLILVVGFMFSVSAEPIKNLQNVYGPFQTSGSSQTSAQVSYSFDYYLISFDNPVTYEQVQIIHDEFDVVGYSGKSIYIGRVAQNKKIGLPKELGATILKLHNTALMDESLMKFSGTKRIYITLYPNENYNLIKSKIEKISKIYKSGADWFEILNADSRQTALISRIIGVSSVSEVVAMEVLNSITSKVIGASGVWNTYGYSGENITVAIADGGVGPGGSENVHLDLRGRTQISAWCDGVKSTTCSGNPTGADLSNHGSYVAGIFVGNGTENPIKKGMAYSSNLLVQSIGNDTSGLLNPPNNISDLFAESELYNARVHSNSYASALSLSIYNLHSRRIDAYSNDVNRNMVIVYGAGNSGPNLSTVSSHSSAKNMISVGAISGLIFPYTVAPASSRGPTNDGRIKPDLVTPGTQISTTQKITNYLYADGTSMSAPSAAGASALVFDYLAQNRSYENPTSALIRAILIAGAEHIGEDLYGTVPNNYEGFGLVNLNRSLEIYPNHKTYYSDAQYNLSTGDSAFFSYEVENSSVPLRVALVWTDPPCIGIISYCAQGALINDLDLKVTAPDGSWWYGNSNESNLNNADRLNVIELVSLDEPQVGNYSIEVSSYVSTSGLQDFALVVIGDGQITSTPSSLQILNLQSTSAQESAQIDWNTNVDANATVAYKLQNEAQWQYAYDEQYSLSHSLNLVNLQPQATYDYQVISCTAEQECKQSQIQIFQTQSDQVPIIENINVIPLGENVALITWTTDILSNSSISYRELGSTQWIYASNPVYVLNHGDLIYDLSAGTTYEYQVSSCTQFNMCVQSDVDTFETPGGPALTISNVGVNSIEYTSANIYWDTNINANSTVRYRQLIPLRYWQYAHNSAFESTHNVPISDLVANTQYEYSAISCTPQGSCAESSSSTFWTQSAPQAQLSNLMSKASLDTVTISFNTDVATNVELSYWPIGSEVPSIVQYSDYTRNRKVRINGLSPDTTYAFRLYYCTNLQACSIKDSVFTTISVGVAHPTTTIDTLPLE